MKNFILSALAVVCLSLVFACKNEKAAAPAKPVTLGSASLAKSAGPDCAKLDDDHHQCAEIKFAWPELKDGSEALKTNVKNWANGFLVGMLAPETSAADAAKMPLQTAVDTFFKTHANAAKGNEGAVTLHWTAECRDTVLLNDGKHLTLRMAGYTYTGGAHGSPLSNVATFDVASGKQLTWDDLVTDKAKVQAMAEQTFRAVRADLFKPEKDGGADFKFDETFEFKLPVNYGLTDKGVYFNYMHYEVTPYAFGDTEFVIPFADFGALLKLKK